MEETKGNALSENVEVTDPQNATEKVETPVESKTEETGTPETETPKETEKGPEPSGAEKRIKQLVREKHERDRKIAELETRLQEKPAAATPTVSTRQVPKAGDFDDYDDYLVAKATWKIQADQEVAEQSRIQRENVKAIKAVEETFAQRISDDSVDHPDIAQVRDRVGQRITLAVGFAVKQSDIAPDIIRYLDANQSEIDRLSKLDIVAAAREIGKIEAKLTSKGGQTKVKSGAPEPVKPAGGGSGSVTTEKDDDEIPVADYMKAFREKSKKK